MTSNTHDQDNLYTMQAVNRMYVEGDVHEQSFTRALPVLFGDKIKPLTPDYDATPEAIDDIIKRGESPRHTLFAISERLVHSADVNNYDKAIAKRIIGHAQQHNMPVLIHGFHDLQDDDKIERVGKFTIYDPLSNKYYTNSLNYMRDGSIEKGVCDGSPAQLRAIKTRQTFSVNPDNVEQFPQVSQVERIKILTQSELTDIQELVMNAAICNTGTLAEVADENIELITDIDDIESALRAPETGVYYLVDSMSMQQIVDKDLDTTTASDFFPEMPRNILTAFHISLDHGKYRLHLMSKVPSQKGKILTDSFYVNVDDSFEITRTSRIEDTSPELRNHWLPSVAERGANL